MDALSGRPPAARRATALQSALAERGSLEYHASVLTH
jgi:hypothetical protein